MAVLETAIQFGDETLIEKAFYDAANVLDKDIRNNLLSAITGLASDAFSDDLESFSIGEHSVMTVSQKISKPNDPDSSSVIKIYAIIEKDTDPRAVRKCMEEALNQFLNRFSLTHIFAMNKKAFKKFPERLNNIFKDLCLKTEDRFKSLF